MAAVEKRERRDSGCCDQAEVEVNGVVYRDAATNTLSNRELSFRQLPGVDDLPCPAVVSSDSHGNELISIATQTCEVAMLSDSDSNQAKASSSQPLSNFYHGAWPFTGKMAKTICVCMIPSLSLRLDTDADVAASGLAAAPETQSVMSFHSSISSHSSRPSHPESHKSQHPHSLAHQVIAESQAYITEPQALLANPPIGSKASASSSTCLLLRQSSPVFTLWKLHRSCLRFYWLTRLLPCP